MHNKSKTLTVISIILSIALILVGVGSFNSFQKVKKLEDEITKAKDNNNVLMAENNKLAEENKLSNESLKIKSETIEKYQKLLDIKDGDLDKIYNTSNANAKKVKELNTIIENNKITIDKLKKEIENLKSQVSQKDADVKKLELELKGVTESNKLANEKLTILLSQVNNILEDVKSKLNDNKENPAMVKVLEEIETNLEGVINSN